MRKRTREGFRSGGLLRSVFLRRHGGELPQDSIDEWSGGAFASAFHKFDTFVEGGTLGDSVEPPELIEGQTQSNENFNVEFRKRLRGSGRDFGVKSRAPP